MAGLRQTIAHSGVYGLGNTLQNLVGFIMLPIYTRFLTPADYGTLSVMQVVLDIANLTFGLRLGMGVFRNYFAADSEADRHKVIASALVFSVLTQAVGTVAVVASSGPLSLAMFGHQEFADYLRLFSVSLVCNAFFLVPFMFLRATKRPLAFVSISVAKLILQLTLNIVFVVYYRMGVPGVIWSNVLSGLLLGLPFSAWTLWQTRLAVSVTEARRLVNYSWPLIFDGFVDLYVSGGNRVGLGRLAGLGDVGLLSLASRMVDAVERTTIKPFNQAWSPQRFEEVRNPDGAETYSRAFMLISLIVVGAGTFLSALAPEVLRIMSAPAFWNASILVPVIMLRSVVDNAVMFTRFGIVLEGRTIEFLKASLAGAALATVVWLLLTPRYGAIGAACSLVAYSVGKLAWLQTRPKSDFEPELPWFRFCSLLAAGALAIVVAWQAPAPLAAAIAFKVAVLAVFGAAVFYSPIVGARERSAVFVLLRDLVSWLRRRTQRG